MLACNDLKISHVNKHVVTKFIQKLNRLYGKTDKLTVLRGRYHHYLGMYLDFRTDGVVQVDMCDYVKETYEMFPNDLGGRVTLPKAEHLREVREDATKLDDKRKQTFHTITARTLFCGKQARPDTLPTISFLTMRVEEPDTNDWQKLSRLMKYMKQTVNDVLTLSAKNLNAVKWWVDGSYAVHKDVKSQTGATMSMGTGSIYSSS